MDLTQAVLMSTIVVLAIFLVVVGFQAYFTLKDLRKTLTHLNQLIDQTSSLVADIKKPVESASSIFGALTTGLGIAHLLKKAKFLERAHERSEK